VKQPQLGLASDRLAVEGFEVWAAVELVSSGVSPRVIVAGLSHASELLLRLRTDAAEAGVMLDRDGTDSRTTISVRRRPVAVEPEASGGVAR